MSKEEAQKKIANIREVLLTHTDTILQNFTFFLGEDHKNHLKDHMDDLNKINEGAKLLKNEILRFLNQEALKKNVRTLIDLASLARRRRT